jgi:hypothetical protein
MAHDAPRASHGESWVRLLRSDGRAGCGDALVDGRLARALSAAGRSGITASVIGDRLTATPRFLSLCGVLALVATGCGLKGLAHDQLYGSADAAIEQPVDLAAPDAPSPDTSDDAPAADAEVDAEAGPSDVAEDATPDVTENPDAPADAPPAACTPALCPADQFCDDISGACLPRAGTGMISGAVYDSCNRAPINAKVGIAGQHACAASGKGAYYFSNIPLGRLTVTAAASGYQLFIQEVTVVPGGNTLNIALERSAPVTCADPAPAAVACSCPEPTCVTP